MLKLLTPLVTSLVKPLSFLFGALFIKRQGAKEAVLKGKEAALEEAKEALKDRENIRNLDDDSLNNIVFLDDDRRKP